MTRYINESERTRILIALGNQPGVGAWFSAWLLALARAAQSRPRNPKPAIRFGSYLSGLR